MRSPAAICSFIAALWMVAAAPAPTAAGPDGSSPSVQAESARPPAAPGDRTTAVQAPPLQAPAPVATPAPGNPVAVVVTSLGDFAIELFSDRAPVSVENFLQYAREGHYDGTVLTASNPTS